jgi:hypothetical protein
MRPACPALLGLLVATACGKGDGNARDKPEPSGSATATTPAPAAGLAITVGGVAQPGQGGFIKRRPDGSLQAYVGEGGACSELLTNVFNGKNTSILIDVPTRLAPDGTESHAVSLVYLDGGNDAAPAGPAPATIEGSTDAGGTAELTVDFTGPDDSGKPVVVKGTVPLAGCGDQDVTGRTFTKARHPSNALLTIANRKFPVMAALRRGSTTELYDFPRDCSGAYYIGVQVTYDGATWTLSGKRFASEIRGEAKGLSITPGAGGTSDDGPTVSLALAGSDRVADYSVAFDGTVEAIDCK